MKRSYHQVHQPHDYWAMAYLSLNFEVSRDIFSFLLDIAQYPARTICETFHFLLRSNHANVYLSSLLNFQRKFVYDFGSLHLISSTVHFEKTSYISTTDALVVLLISFSGYDVMVPCQMSPHAFSTGT